MARDYRRLLTKLYQDFRPDKVAEVDALLEQFKGREEELMYKIVMKYGEPRARTDAQRKWDEYNKKKTPQLS